MINSNGRFFLLQVILTEKKRMFLRQNSNLHLLFQKKKVEQAVTKRLTLCAMIVCEGLVMPSIYHIFSLVNRGVQNMIVLCLHSQV